MERKVIQLASKTLVVSIPNPFVRKYHVKKGQDVHVSEKEGGILISFRGKPESKKSHMDADSLGTFDRNYIAYLYQKGYDEVRVTYDDPTVYEELRAKTSDLMGYEIVEKGKGRCVIRSVTSVSPEEFDTMLRKTFLLLLETAELSLAGLRERNTEKLRTVIVHEKENNKLTDFLKRVLNKHQHQDHEKTSLYYAFARDMEKTADCYRAIAEHALTNPRSLGPDAQKFHERANRLLRLLYELFYKFEKEKAREFLTLRNELLGTSRKLLARGTNDTFTISQLSTVIHHVGELYGPYFTIMVA